ncbi:TniQ family protein [Phenylobacterium sp.]|uniref:TniQ family protein n=1 Tax=Phenylobacterium sp. TaxID=1871053 RepID=UPI00396C7D13
MGFEAPITPTLALPRVEPVPGEALSSWLVRIAHRQLLSLHEVGWEIGVELHEPDRNPDRAALAGITARTGRSIAELEAMVHPAFLKAAAPAGLPVPLAWAVCRSCLQEDVAMERPPHVRVNWTHPLATCCPTHREPLVPHGQAGVDLVGDPTNEGWTRASEPLDLNIARMQPEELRLGEAAAALIESRSPAAQDLLRVWTLEVLDVVDALCTQMNICMGRGPLMSGLEMRWGQVSTRGGSPELRTAAAYEISTAARLSHVRAAMRILGAPGCPPTPDPALTQWVEECARLSVPKARQRALKYASLDPLVLVALALPVTSFHLMGARAEHWSPHGEARWRAAATVAAFSGFA